MTMKAYKQTRSKQWIVSSNYPIFLFFWTIVNIAISSSEIECESDGSCYEIDDSCIDQHTECPFWAKHGECDKNPNYMTFQCAFSCGTCDRTIKKDSEHPKKSSKCEDLHALCPLWAQEGECLINPNFMSSACVLSCWLCVDVDEARMRGEEEDTIQRNVRYVDMELGPNQKLINEATKTNVRNMEKYAKDIISSPNYDEIRHKCTNKNDLCSFWATEGKCNSKVTFMMKECSLACTMCEQIEQFSRCHKKKNILMKQAGYKDPVNAIFQNMESNHEWMKYGPEFLSRPTDVSPDAPWLLRFDSLLTSDETDEFINIGNAIGWKSITTKEENESYEYERTYCNIFEKCETNDIYQIVLNRIASILMVPEDNFEHVEMVKFSNVGDSYGRHDDYNVHDDWKPAGPRILSIMINLSNVEMGGASGFPALDWTFVPPKKGQVLIWSNVDINSENDDDNYGSKSAEMIHEVLPIVEGQLFNAHIWVHPRNWRKEYKKNCV